MNSFLKEFKEFAMRGNVMDMAVGVIIGAAFGKIDFSGLSFNVEDATVKYGMFLQNILDFIIIAFCIFLMIKGMNTLAKRWKEEPKSEESAKPNNEEVLLTEIRDLLKEK